MDALALAAPLAPAVLVAAAGLAFARPGGRPALVPQIAEGAALAALALAALGMLRLMLSGATVVSFGEGPWLVAMSLDAIAATMALLVAFVGWVVTRFARRYLDGEAREGWFHALMLATLAAALLLVQAGSLLLLASAFVLVGLGLRQLLLFYPERAEARRAADKFTPVWGAGGVAGGPPVLCRL